VDHDRQYTHVCGVAFSARPAGHLSIIVCNHMPILNISQLQIANISYATATDYRITYSSRFKWGVNGHVGELSNADLASFDQAGRINNAFWKPKQ
jgi:hypothetical protein